MDAVPPLASMDSRITRGGLDPAATFSVKRQPCQVTRSRCFNRLRILGLLTVSTRGSRSGHLPWSPHAW